MRPGKDRAVPAGTCARKGILIAMKTARGAPIAIALAALLASCAWIENAFGPAPEKAPPPAAAPVREETKPIAIVQSPPGAQAGTGKQTAALPPARPQPKPNMLDPKILVGLDQVAVEELIGKPLGINDEPPATVWSYRNEDCTLDVFFYLDIGTHKLRALSYDVKTGSKSGLDGAAKLCVGRIQAENRAKQR